MCIFWYHYVSSLSFNLHMFSSVFSQRPKASHIYRFLNLLLYIDIFSLIPCSVNSSQLNSLKLYTNNLCILSLVRILSGFLSLNYSEKHAFRQKTRVIMQLISLVSFLSMIALPWHLFIQCLETAQIFCPVLKLFTVAKQV